MWQAAFRSARPGKINNLSTLKLYGSRYKLTLHKAAVKVAGYEQPPPDGGGNGAQGRGPPKRSERERFQSSLSRTRSAVFELAACNPWDHFCTWTLADNKGFDRYDLAPWYKDFSQWIRNQRRLHKAPLAYLIVPEGHKDGAWHLHALVKGLPLDRLKKLTQEDFLPYRLLAKIRAGDTLYSWPAYQEKYGWCTLEPIKDPDRCASYIAKYVTKAFGPVDAPGQAPGPAPGGWRPGKKMYYASHGLQRAQLLWSGQVYYQEGQAWEFQNDYVATKWLDEKEKERFCHEQGIEFAPEATKGL